MHPEAHSVPSRQMVRRRSVGAHSRSRAAAAERPGTLHHQRLLLGLLVAYSGTYLAWLIGPFGALGDRTVVATFAIVPVRVLAAGLALGVARDGRLDRATRRSWLLLAIALGSYAAGSAASAAAVVVGWAVPFPSLIDVLLLAFYPLAFGALVTFPTVPGAAADRLRLALDVAIWVTGGGLVVAVFVFGPGVAGLTGDPAAAAATLGYPLGDLMVLAGLATAALRRPLPGHRRATALVLIGMVALLVDDIIWSALTAAGAYAPGHPVDAIWMASTILIAAAAVVQRRDATDAGLGIASHRMAGRVGISLVPYLFLSAGYWALLSHVDPAFSPQTVQLAAGSLLLGVLVIGRQVVSLRENGRLLRLDTERRSAARLSSIVRDAADVLLVVEPDGTIRYASPAIERVLRVSSSSVVGAQLGEVLDPERAARLLEDGPASHGPVPLTHDRRDGRRMELECVVSDLRTDPDVGGYAVTLHDVTERRGLEGRLAFLALHDPLTQLANRALFRDRVSHALIRPERQPGSLGLLTMDLDDFKRLNDSLGHPAGDALLVQTAERLRRTVGTGDTVARTGGDEFGVLVEDLPARGGLDMFGERLRDAMSEPFELDGLLIHLSVSIGTVVNDVESSADDMLRDSDVALNTAKARGKARVVSFEPAQRDLVRNRLALEVDLRGAAERDELALQFQPIVDLATGRATGLEALARRRHPRLGDVPPSTFIPLAEASGLIAELGHWVLVDACRRLTRIRHDSGLGSLTMAVNVSAPELESPDFVASVEIALEANGLTPRDLILEVTESALVREAAVRQLRVLRRSGVRVAIDDFGTGYSSLAYLQRLPVDLLKIDKAFVRSVDDAQRSRDLAAAIIQMAHALGIQTIAEGVERPEQAEQLVAIGCDLAQGYWFGRPLDADQVGRSLESRSLRDRGGRARQPARR